MATYSVIQKSQLEGAQRLDAEYYQPEYLELAKEIRDQKGKNLQDVVIIRSGTTPKDRDDTLTEGVILLKTTDIRNNILLKDGDYYHITPKIAQRMLKTKLQPSDVLVNIVGATLEVIGRASLIPTDFPESNITQAMALLRIKDVDYLPEYIFSFLMSKYGQFQTDRLARPTGQFNLNLQELGRVLIPQISLNLQKKIVEIIKEIISLQEKSSRLYQQAEDLLLEELGLEDFQIPEDLTYVVNYSDTENVERVDADYFQPKYEELLSRIKKHNPKSLGQLVSIKKGFEPGSEAYQNEGKLFIRVSSLSKNGVENRDQKYLSDELYQKLKANFEPKVGEILLTKDATPGIAYVLKEPVEGIISGGILRLATKTDLDSEYLALCINSIVGRLQTERDAGGSIIVHWKPEQIKNILIPVLPKPVQQKVAELVRKSHEARKKSKGLLEEAKRKVEEMIEKGGD